jgi:hypothetical protein
VKFHGHGRHFKSLVATRKPMLSTRSSASRQSRHDERNSRGR